MEEEVIVLEEKKKLPKVEIEKTLVSNVTKEEVTEMEQLINSVKYDNELLAVFMTLLVSDDVMGTQLEQHFADYFGSQGMLRE